VHPSTKSMRYRFAFQASSCEPSMCSAQGESSRSVELDTELTGVKSQLKQKVGSFVSG
jgi:hypothetical protein